MLKCLFHENLTELALNCLCAYVSNENGVSDNIPKGIVEAWNASKWTEDSILVAIEIFN